MPPRPTADPQAIAGLLEERIGHRFEEPSLAVQAVTHSSAKDAQLPSNERMEFFGDAIVGLVVSEFLFGHYPDCEEGELSTMKSVIVSAKTLSAKAEELGLDRLILLGRGLSEKQELPRSILCNTFEAVVAALYLDAGFEKARDFVLKQLTPAMQEVLRNPPERNYKSMLQDYAQRNLASIPQYRVVQESGPDHRKRFEVVVQVGSKTYGPSWGDNKKEAEQSAAMTALRALGLLEPGMPSP
jgi:ribonuclease-3